MAVYVIDFESGQIRQLVAGANVTFTIGSGTFTVSASSGGTLTGSGVANQVAVWDAATNLTGHAELTFDPVTKLVSLNGIQFALSPTPSITGAEGQIWWDNNEGTLNVGMPGGNVVLQVGQENLIKVKNDTGGPLANGEIVYISGATGDNVRVSKAQANGSTGDKSIAMMTEDVGNNQHGYANSFGLVHGLNTNAYPAGTPLYLSAATAGAWTDTPPSPPNHVVHIGFVVRQHATEGVIFVFIDPGQELSELHDVVITAPVDKDVLTYNGSTQLWENSNRVEVDLEERAWFRAR